VRFFQQKLAGSFAIGDPARHFESYRIGDTVMKMKGILALTFVIFILFMGAIQAPDTPKIDWWVLANGGGPTSTGSSVSMNATLGQPIASPRLSGGDISLVSGYWGMGWKATYGGTLYMPLVSR
jgi:hypothetical protein